MAPPQHAALISCGTSSIRRRSSCAYDPAALRSAIQETFDEVDKDGNGLLTSDEIRQFLAKLLPLADPTNELDSICAALDKDSDGKVDVSEFYTFVTDTVDRHLSMGKALMVDDIVRESFQDVLKQTKQEREVVTHAFVLSTHECPEKERLFNPGWMHKVFDEFYGAPSDPAAPKYQCQRTEYLKQRLTEAVNPQFDLHKQHHGHAHPHAHTGDAHAHAQEHQHKGDSIDSDTDSVHSRRDSLPSRPPVASLAPNEDSFRRFCKNWLTHIQELELEENLNVRRVQSCAHPSSPAMHDVQQRAMSHHA